ncbi:unnamed protein product [Pleuronectes platessa]|uniref:Uncharacterized protein n=1 Tax=Pleuronectes platessa TaxID=8262 RepID=A0A9N7Z229_PLEPL|nr:unnamed protein product [Pleuronectes platessa]
MRRQREDLSVRRLVGLPWSTEVEQAVPHYVASDKQKIFKTHNQATHTHVSSNTGRFPATPQLSVSPSQAILLYQSPARLIKPTNTPIQTTPDCGGSNGSKWDLMSKSEPCGCAQAMESVRLLDFLPRMKLALCVTPQ